MHTRRKVFISYYHYEDQYYKNELCRWNTETNTFIDKSVSTNDIDDRLPHQTIRRKIRDEYLRDSSVTILLAGKNTAKRKHVDWELYSSMINGSINKQSGILIINLPETGCTNITAAHGDFEKKSIYSEYQSWITIDKRTDYKSRYPHLPERIIDNLLNSDAKISVTNWSKIAQNPNHLSLLIELAATNRIYQNYDLKRPMRMNNGPSLNSFLETG